MKAHTVDQGVGVASGGVAESHKNSKGRRATYSYTEQTDQVLNEVQLIVILFLFLQNIDDESYALYMQV